MKIIINNKFKLLLKIININIGFLIKVVLGLTNITFRTSL
jgi:hypothetical protein